MHMVFLFLLFLLFSLWLFGIENLFRLLFLSLSLLSPFHAGSLVFSHLYLWSLL